MFLGEQFDLPLIGLDHRASNGESVRRDVVMLIANEFDGELGLEVFDSLVVVLVVFKP